MIARAARLLVKLALLGLVVWIAQQAWTRWVNGPKVAPSSAPWPPVGGAAEGSRSAGTASAPVEEAAPLPTEAAAPAVDTPAPEAPEAPASPAKPPPAKRAAKKAAPTGNTVPGKIVAAKKGKGTASKHKWLPPEADGCPPTHQVKAKVSSMIYHLPGMAAYARTTPDRCYATAEDAEADGFARAKR